MTLSVDQDISVAKSLNSCFYLNEEYYSLCLQKIFKNSWQFVGHKSQYSNNTQTPLTLFQDSINEPIVLIKNNGVYSFLSNVCTHRGHIITQKKCTKKTMKCTYHGRLFDLNGKMLSMPGFKNVKNFPSDSDNLVKLPSFEWSDFLFTGITPKIRIESLINDFSNRLKKFPFDNLRYSPEFSKTYYLDANWALYCENYLEGLHVPFVHKGLNGEIDIQSYKTELLDNGVLQYTKDKRNDVYAYYYWIFPNMMFNFYDWGLSINLVEPMSINRTRVKFLTYPVVEDIKIKSKITELHDVEIEDEEVVLNVQKGIQSQFYENGRYSAEYEKGTHHFHRLICDYLR
ncbi:MAG: choline monooxygenase [Candidatus Marinimicrobia bacterium]|nr:choline monooxygenase [Candidatus Neomarinimicrobiota bacterium]|tara:strand:+ start:11570 stop:12598 length:1029 start_codon:yes stop_codon:yes gene_type:complete